MSGELDSNGEFEFSSGEWDDISGDDSIGLCETICDAINGLCGVFMPCDRLDMLCIWWCGDVLLDNGEPACSELT